MPIKEKQITAGYNTTGHSCRHLFVVIACCCYWMSACHQPVHSTTDTSKPALRDSSIINNGTLVAPTVVQLQSRPPAIVTKAGQPVVIKDVSGTGIPFFTNYSTAQGLPVNNIICSAADKAGNLWFGTGGAGISRYDGRAFVNFNTAQGLISSVVFCMMEDRGSNLWVGTSTGVSKYNGRYFTNYSTAQGLAGNFITCMLQDNKGSLWFGTHDGGISRYDGQHFSNYTVANGLAGNFVRCMIQDMEGNLWIGTDAGGLSKYNGRQFTTYNKKQGLPDTAVNCIAQDKEGHLWIGTNSGACRYDGNHFTNFTTADGLAANDIYCMYTGEEGYVWMGTHSHGVSRFDGNHFTNFSVAEGLADNKINSILRDRSGNIWISSQGGGISRYGDNAFTHYTTAQGLAGNLVFSAGQDNSGNLWFGTYEGGVSMHNGRQFANYSKKQGLPDISVWSILKDRDGNTWFGTDRAGAVKFDGTHFTSFTTTQGIASNAIICMLQDKRGNIWMGTRENGVSKFDGKSFTNYSTAQGLAGNAVWSIAQDKEGHLWFGTHDGGLSKLDGDRFIHYGIAQGLASNTFNCLLADKSGMLWLGTDSKGISTYDGKKFTNYTTADGLSDDAIGYIVEDRTRDMVWIGTNKGFSGVKEITPGSPKVLQFENFTRQNGYPVTDVSTGGMFADNKGIVWAGSGSGKLVRFDYGAIHPKKIPPIHLVIQNIGINNNQVCWNCADSLLQQYRGLQFDSTGRFYPIPFHLVVPYRYNSISIDFAAVEPALPEQVQYQYKLEGYNNEWSAASNITHAVFGNMPGGSYTFRLKAKNAFGAAGEVTWSFRVLPPWWMSWWAWLSYIVLTGFLLYTLYSLRVDALKRKQAALVNTIVTTQEQERKRIAQDLHDTIGARLTHVNVLSALGQHKIHVPLQMSDHLNRISGEVQSSADALDDIVWSIDSSNDTMEEITARMRRHVAAIFDASLTVYQLQVDEPSLPSRLEAGKRRDLFLVFTEAVNNIQKHAGATAVHIQIHGENNLLVLQVTDNGKGFDKTQPTHRNGVKNMHNRMQKWDGDVRIASAPAQGTTVTIVLPVATPSLKRGIRSWFKKG